MVFSVRVSRPVSTYAKRLGAHRFSLVVMLAALAIVSSGSARGQIRGVGLKGGIAMTSFNGEDSENQRRTGVHAGLMFPVTVANGIDVQLDVVYAQQGTLPDNDITLTYNYIYAPIVVKVNNRGFFLEAGGQVGRLLNAKIKDDTQSASVIDQVREFDAGLVGGLGYTYSYSFVAGMRHTRGLRNTLADDVDDLRFTNVAWQFYLAYLFGG